MTTDDVMAEVFCMTADDHNPVHNWRFYVPEELEKLWPSLSLETRLAIYFLTEQESRCQEWD